MYWRNCGGKNFSGGTSHLRDTNTNTNMKMRYDCTERKRRDQWKHELEASSSYQRGNALFKGLRRAREALISPRLVGECYLLDLRASLARLFFGKKALDALLSSE